MAAWYEELFDERYLIFYDEVLQRGLAVADADFVDSALALPPGAAVLDLGCGIGRHAVPLARLGYRVTGVDLSQTMLGYARRLAAEQGVEASFLQRDMRSLEGLGPFAACVCLYTAFGYFDDEQNAAVLRAITGVLEPGGKLVLDVTNPLALLPGWPSERWREGPFGVTREVARYDPLTARLTAQRTLFRSSGGTEQLPSSSVRMYAPHELVALLGACGLAQEQLHGGLRGEPFDWKRSPRQIWIARRE